MIFLSNLTEPERQALEAFTQDRPGRLAQRAWIALWSAEQVPVSEIAERLHLEPKTVRKWLRRYQAAGCSGLADAPRSGRPKKLTPGAEQAIFTQVQQPPWTCGYVFAIWTVATLSSHLVRRCRQRVTPWLVRQALRAHRFRFRRPKHGPRRMDPEREAIHQHIGRRIAEAALGTAVLVEDETDIRLFPVLRRMSMRIGAQVRLPAPLSNQKRTVFGTIEVHTGEVFHCNFARKRTAEMIAFLEALLEHYAGRRLLVILDHASIHKSKALRGWLAEHLEVELIYLPKYAVHRDNPIEKLWWQLKGQVTANRCCRSIQELLTVVERYFTQLTPEQVFQLVG
jgi:transposase